MQSGTHSKSVLELGKRLVAQLDVADDILGQWMAHDISARIDAIEKMPDQATQTMRDECAKAILTLWEHRHSLPAHLRPFLDIEPITRTLAALDTERGDDYRYFRSHLRSAALEGVNEPTTSWLELAFSLDYSARVLIQHALRTAGASAADQAVPWVEAAKHAGVGAEPDGLTIDFLLERLYPDEAGRQEKADLARKKDLRDKIGQLKRFAGLAEALAAELLEQIGD